MKLPFLLFLGWAYSGPAGGGVPLRLGGLHAPPSLRNGALRVLLGLLLGAGMLSRAASAEPTATVSLAGGVAVDLRPAFTNWGLPQRLQNARGTCSVFTMTGALEYALARQQGRGTVLSVEYLNWASNAATTNSGDGGFFSDLWAGFVAHGICTEADLPYRPDYDPKLQPDAAVQQRARIWLDHGLRLAWIKPWNVRTGLTGRQFREIQRVLGQQWPVCGGFRWPKREHWQAGVLQMAPPEGVFDGHSVLLVGYRDDPQQPGGGVFLVRNSGGSLHDAALSYEYVRAYMNDAAWISPAP
jgi:hypothetical protein